LVKLFLVFSTMYILVVVDMGCEGSSSSRDAIQAPDSGKVDLRRLRVCPDGSSDFESIQSALDAARNGSVIEVCAGTYKENLTVQKKTVTLRSVAGKESTFIEAITVDSTVRVLEVDAPGVTIEGFSIRGGKSDGSGGGVYCLKSTLTLVDDDISLNSANDGGGVAAKDCSLVMRRNRMFNNQASVRGGGAYISTSEGVFENNEVFDNEAAEGGGLAVVSAGTNEPSERSFASSSFEIRNNTIRNNAASPSSDILYNRKETGGGGIWLLGSSPLIGNVVQDNLSRINGGGVYVVNGVASEIVGNEIKGNRTFEDGGGLCINMCGGRMADNVITENRSSDDAGGVRIYIGLDMVIENNTISRNVARDASGGIKTSHATNRFLNNIVEGNRADTAGGLELDNDSSIVQGCRFINNRARLGGGIHSKAAERPITIKDTVFEGNIAEEYGGAVHFENDAYAVTLTGIEARNNQAKIGGAIATNNARLELSDSVFSGNRASEKGGALYLSGYEEALKDELITVPVEVTTNEEEPKLVKLRRVRMENNSARQGGAVFATERTRLDMANLIVVGNTAEERGGGMSCISANGTVSNAVITDNKAPSAAGLLLREAALIELRNNIVTDNGDGEGVLVEGDPPALWQYNDVYNNRRGDYAGMPAATGSAGNIGGPPNFVHAEERFFQLAQGSICVDAGDPDSKWNDPDGTRADMGAYGGPEGTWKE
jgi:predicted outer membrane repeat protein